MGERVDLVPGTLDMLVMKAVSAESLHGLGIARWIESVTGDGLTVEEGSLSTPRCIDGCHWGSCASSRRCCSTSRA